MKRVTFTTVAIALLFSLTFNALAYDQAAAQVYADSYVNGHNPVFRDWLPYKDCTNFVSQCLRAGGLQESADWYYTGYFTQSLTWVKANELKWFMKGVLSSTLLGRWSKYEKTNLNGIHYNAYINNSSNIYGLGSEVIFYDWEGDGEMNHASIVIGTGNPKSDPHGTEVGDLIDSHSNSRKWKYWHLDYYNQDHIATTDIYAYRLPSNV